MDIDVSTSIKSVKVQNTMVTKVASAALEIVNGALWASMAGTLPYLNNVAKENKMKVNDLVNKDENKELLMKSLRNLYVGKGTDTYKPTDNEVNSFRNYVNNVTDNYNTTPENFFSDYNNVDIFKRGV
jgi:hypothetical protein